MNRENFKCWREKMDSRKNKLLTLLVCMDAQLSIMSAAHAMKMDEKSPRSIALACSAIEAGLNPFGEP